MSTTAPPPSAAAKVWLITGCSTGFGREMAIVAHSRGDLVIATARKIEALETLRAIGCDTLALDVTASDQDVQHVVAQAHALHGRIDILVNNAGIGLVRPIEDATSAEVVDVFSTNVFGLLRVTRAVLPYMRAQRSGTIGNIGSGSGRSGYPAIGIYGASKFAVAGISQSLALELAPFNVDVVVIEPGVFRSDTTPSRRWPAPSPAYERVVRSTVDDLRSVAPGDAAKGAQLIVEALAKTGRAANRKLPARLPLGGDMFAKMQATINRDQQELNEWKDFTDARLFARDSEG